MGRCSYTWDEWDEEKYENVKKCCQKETWAGSDEFCIFHDPSPEKDVNLFKEMLEEHIQSETTRHNFIGYQFPKGWDFSGKKFRTEADFSEATFHGAVGFSKATFQGAADFSKATFQGAVGFSEATFQGAADFVLATFQGPANFSEATFQGPANFRGATFQGTAYFGLATFQTANFSGATFQDAYFGLATFRDTDFSGATFQGPTNFSGATFQAANFMGATFQGPSNFSEATFQAANFRRATFEGADFSEATFQAANFRRATFEGADFRRATFLDAYFRGATFQTANFSEATFQGAAGFGGATFQGPADFGLATFQREVELAPRNIERMDLRYTRFLFQSYITTDLAKCLFHRSIIENVSFIDCIWPKRYIIYEEEHMNDEKIHLSFAQLETIYRDLKQNMQNHGDYSRAGEFYYREMEIRRKGASKRERLWLTLYKAVAGYGERPLNTAAVSASIVFLFAFLYGTSDCLHYSVENPCLQQKVIDVIYFSFVTFTTLGLGDIAPVTTLGKVLICFEAVMGAFMIAVFVVVFVRKMSR